MTPLRFAAVTAMLSLAACSNGEADEPTNAAGPNEERALSEAAEMLDERPAEGEAAPPQDTDVSSETGLQPVGVIDVSS